AACRETDVDGRPTPCTVARGVNVAMMLLDQMARDRQSKPETAVAPGRSTIGLSEALEDVGDELLGDSDTRILHVDRNRITLTRAADIDLPAVRRELDRIGEYVAEHLMQTFGIALDRRKIVGDGLDQV